MAGEQSCSSDGPCMQTSPILPAGSAPCADARGRQVSRRLDWNLSATDALQLVRSDPHPVALLGDWAGGTDIVTASPVVMTDDPGTPLAGGPASSARNVRFGGGWIGYLGFGAAREFLPVPPPASPRRLPPSWFGYYHPARGRVGGAPRSPLPAPPPASPRRLPPSWFGYYDHALVRDRATGKWFFEAVITPGRETILDQRFAELIRRARNLLPEPRAYFLSPFRVIPAPAEHKAAVRETVRRIRNGDIFQANICLRLAADFRGNPLDV